MSNKATFIIILAQYTLGLFFITSCDVPTQTRYGSKTKNQESAFNLGQNNTSNQPTTVDPTPFDTEEEIEVPLEVSHCSWSRDAQHGFMSLSSHLSPNESTASEGAFTLCQSGENEHVVFFQLKHPIEDAQLCLIPTYQLGTSTTYIGEPRCFFATNSLKIYRIELYKNRPGFTHLPITGVMAMKDKAYAYPSPFNKNVLSPDAFLFCNQQLVHPIRPDARYCSAFKAAGHYIYKQF